jgi:hypothetical protein
LVIKDFDLNSDIWAFRGHYDAASVKKLEKRSRSKIIATGYIILLLKESIVKGVHASLYPTRVMSSILKNKDKGSVPFDEIAISEPTPLHQGIKSTVNKMLEGKQIVNLDSVSNMIKTRKSLMGHIHCDDHSDVDQIPTRYRELIGSNRTLPTGEQYSVIDVKEQFSGEFIGVICMKSNNQKHCRDIQLILGDIIPVDAF